ncbi:MAG TPA: DNA recombination protein RmuC, partial [Thermoanaerobaculia bacterium]|nr:DNA recombination protein RmuC [Thermoanaerobaculia bacterium]
MAVLSLIAAVVGIVLLLLLSWIVLRGSRRLIAVEATQSREESRAEAIALRQELTAAMGTLATSLRADANTARVEAAENRRSHREEITRTLDSSSQRVIAAVSDHGTTQRQDLEAIRAQVVMLTESNEQRIGDVRRTVDERLKEIAAGNARELQEMRATVDEKLQGTLNQRLGESFALVTQRLEEVHRGFGEMQALATGVGDLKKVLSNVRSRGIWG